MAWNTVAAPSCPSFTGAQDDPLLRQIQQIAAEERQLRQVLEERLRQYMDLVASMASAFMGAELDARLRSDPEFCARATPEQWRELLAAAIQRRAAEGWRARGNGHSPQTPCDGGLASCDEGPAPRNGEPAPGDGGGATPEKASSAEPNGIGAGPCTARDSQEQPSEKQAPQNGKRTPQGGERSPAVPLPEQPPAGYEELLENWERAGQVLALLGTSGISVRQTLAELLTSQLGGVRPNAGSIRRLFARLSKSGFLEELHILLPGSRPHGRTTVMVCRLSEKGKALLRACGIKPVPSEWELLQARYGDETTRIGLLCELARQARRRGYQVAVCQAQGRAEPDLLLARDSQNLYLCAEVGAEEAEASARCARWRRQMALQKRVVLATPRAEEMAALVSEAQKAGAEHGLATNLQALLDDPTADLWVSTW